MALITGGMGFIGRNLLERINADIIDLKVGSDILEPLDFRGVDSIIHLAAQTGVPSSIIDPMGDYRTNVAGTVNVLETARRFHVKRVVIASSGAAATELSPYGASKRCIEAYARAYYASYGLETVCLRLSNVYGPHSYHKNSIIAKFLRNWTEGKVSKINGNGTQVRDFIYVDDVVDAILAALEAPVAGKVLNIGTGKGTSLNRLVELLPGVFEYTNPLKGDVPSSVTNPYLTKEVLNWEPKTTLSEGIKKTIQYFEELKWDE